MIPCAKYQVGDLFIHILRIYKQNNVRILSSFAKSTYAIMKLVCEVIISIIILIRGILVLIELFLSQVLIFAVTLAVALASPLLPRKSTTPFIPVFTTPDPSLPTWEERLPPGALVVEQEVPLSQQEFWKKVGFSWSYPTETPLTTFDPKVLPDYIQEEIQRTLGIKVTEA